MVDVDRSTRIGHPILFGLSTLFAFLTAATTTWLVSQYNMNDSYPNASFRDRLKFGVFVSWWTFLFSIMYIIFFLTGKGGVVGSVASHGVFLGITWIFWTALAASVTQMLGGGQRCSVSRLVYCNQNVAVEAFAWLEWITLTITLFAVIFLGSRAIRNGSKMSDPLGA